MRPSDWHPVAACLDAGGVDHDRLVLDPIAVGHVQHIVVAVPCHPDHSGRMVDTEVQTDDARPVRRHRERGDLDRLFDDREHATTSQNGNALRTRFALMLWVAGDDRIALLLGVMLCIVDRHGGDGRTCRLVQQEPLHHLGHAKQWREGHEHQTACCVGTCQAFGVDRQRWLFVEPDVIDCVGLPLRATLIVAVELDHAVFATNVTNDNARHRIGNACTHAGVAHVRMRYRAGAPRFPDLWRPQQQTLHTLASQFG